MAENQQGSPEQKQQGQQFNIAKIYLKDTSFESPGSPQVFQGEWAPSTNVELNTRAQKFADAAFEVVLTVTVTTKLGEKVAYLCEVQQAGIFQIDGFDEKTLKGLLGSYCPNILFPYAREAVSDLVNKGGFPQLIQGLQNFAALYAQRLAAEQKQAESAQQH